MNIRQMVVTMLLVVSCGMVLTPTSHAEVLKGNAPIILTLMTHTDGTYRFGAGFVPDTKKIEFGLDLYGLDVKMNLEASKAFAIADTVGFLKKVRDAGHGVGTHCNDVKATDDTLDLPAIIADNKTAVDTALGETSTNVSISGICSKLDWVGAAAGALFKITDGSVGLCYLSMPMNARPAGLTDALIISTYFHESAPFGFRNRISPIRLEDSSDYAPDSPGKLTLSNGGVGELDSLSEGRITCGTSCVLDKADFDVVYTAIETVKALKGPREVGRINIHVPIKLMVEPNRALLTGFLGRLRMYAAANTIVFGTEKDVSETYDAWR